MQQYNFKHTLFHMFVRLSKYVGNIELPRQRLGIVNLLAGGWSTQRVVFCDYSTFFVYPLLCSTSIYWFRKVQKLLPVISIMFCLMKQYSSEIGRRRGAHALILVARVHAGGSLLRFSPHKWELTLTVERQFHNVSSDLAPQSFWPSWAQLQARGRS